MLGALLTLQGGPQTPLLETTSTSKASHSCFLGEAAHVTGGSSSSSQQHTSPAARLTASTAPGRRGKAGHTQTERHSSREDKDKIFLLQHKNSSRLPYNRDGWLAGAHHGRLCPDRRWAVLLLPPEPHLGELLRAGRTLSSISFLSCSDINSQISCTYPEWFSTFKATSQNFIFRLIDGGPECPLLPFLVFYYHTLFLLDITLLMKWKSSRLSAPVSPNLPCRTSTALCKGSNILPLKSIMN